MQDDLRNHFAGLALKGICASGPSINFTDETLTRDAYLEHMLDKDSA